MVREQAPIFPPKLRGDYVLGVRVSLPRDKRHHIRLLSLCATIWFALAFAHPANAAGALNFPPSDFDILSAESGQLIGHGHYAVDQTVRSLTLRGENRYLNREYDIEEDQLTIVAGAGMPQLTSF